MLKFSSFNPPSPPYSPYADYSPQQFESTFWNIGPLVSEPQKLGRLHRLLSSESLTSPLQPNFSLPSSPITSLTPKRLRHLFSTESLPTDDNTVPNLELHSAAASGNVGLVHYALTHGQPVNSVLHGVLPLHAACSGGSVSVVRMLIERGADVNAPRLPRRYSDNKKNSAPSVGTSGSTPLHFAAANGHAPIVQILLTCGATPDKPDKNGLTPEDLAQANNHDDVIRVLRVFERLKQQEQNSGEHSGETSNLKIDERAALVDYPWSDRASSQGDRSPTASTSHVEEEEHKYHSVGSRKGKERATSFASIKSDSSGRMRKGLDSLWRRNRVVSESAVDEDYGVSNRPPRIEIPTFDHDIDLHSPLSESFSPESPSSGIGEALARIGSSNSHSSQQLTTIAESEHSPPENLQGPSSSQSQTSSRRPSLPSILERATHPGAAFRAAMRREHQPTSPTFSVGETSPKSHHSSSFFRGRLRSNESNSSQSSSSHHHGRQITRKYMSKGSLMSLFRRGDSPPSRSPSPPSRAESGRIIGNDELDEGIARLKRASLDMERESRANSSEFIILDEPPMSAPVTKTTFFPTSPGSPGQLTSDHSDNGDERQTSSGSPAPAIERPYTRPRHSSEVVSPSPLANEWGDEDSDTPGIRRSQTEIIKSHPSSPRRMTTSQSSSFSFTGTKPRSNTLPSGFAGYQPQRVMSGPPLGAIDWDDDVDLRKVASGMFRREGGRVRQDVEAEVEAETAVEVKPEIEPPNEVEESGDEDFHDASPDLGEVVHVERQLEMENGTSEHVQPDPVPEHQVDAAQSRMRGLSIGSVTTESSRIYTPPGSSLRISSVASDAGSFDRFEDRKSFSDSRSMPPPPPINTSLDSRSRGKSISSVSSGQSGLAYSYHQSASSPATSITPLSAASITLGSGFPPVPEHEVASHPQNKRTISSHAEAKDLVKQNERDILQIAQLPPSLDSSRSLSAQLAAYGESHAIEREFALAERRHGSRFGSTDGSSESASFFSADSGGSRSRGARSDTSRRTPSSLSRSIESSGPSKPRATSNPNPLIKIDAPKSSVPSINSIYDKRAAAYRERLMALTAVPPIPSGQSRPRPRAASSSANSWVSEGPMSRQSSRVSARTAGSIVEENDRHLTSSNPLPYASSMASSYLIPPKPQRKLHGHGSHSQGKFESDGSTQIRETGNGSPARQTYGSHSSPPSTAGSSYSSRSPHPAPRHHTHLHAQSLAASPTSAPAPIADVLSTRFQGLQPPPQHPSSISHHSRSSNTQTTRLSSGQPHVSIFSSRYSGPIAGQRDGNGNDIDSDEGEFEPRQLTVIENDWRGGHIVVDDFKKGRKWGLPKGLPHLGRK